jgi:hypothetical protein
MVLLPEAIALVSSKIISGVTFATPLIGKYTNRGEAPHDR